MRLENSESNIKGRLGMFKLGVDIIVRTYIITKVTVAWIILTEV